MGGKVHTQRDVPHTQSKRGMFMTIFGTLGLLTLVEVYIPDVYSAEWNGTTKMLLLTFLAVTKAWLVAVYFMHLKWEKPWLKYIALMPAYMGIAVIILMLETVYRQVGA
jgi:cytochrome c oxidase subunit 4